MANKKTGRALLMSVLSLLLCCAMLVGTTFAWFTDSVTSGINQINAGNLDVALAHQDSKMTAPADVTASTVLFDEVQLWEPGAVAYEILTVQNKGTLALKYSLAFLFDGENSLNGHTLSEVLKVAVIEDYSALDLTDREAVVAAAKASAVNGALSSLKVNDHLDPKTDDAPFLVAIYWEPGVNDNNYNANNNQATSDGQPLHIKLGVQLNATQYTQETDSFNNQYDKDATLPAQAYGSAEVEDGAAAAVVTVNDINTGRKLAVLNIPADAIEEDVENVSVHIVETEVYENVTVADDETARSFNVTVTGLKEGNTTPVKVELKIGSGLSNVKVYHYGDLVTGTSYTPAQEEVTFHTTSFSPFTVVYDAEPVSEGTTEPANPEDLPEADVERSPEYENVSLAWGSYGSWNPSDVSQQLEAAYTFAAQDTAATVASNPYKDWTCDYYVSIDTDLEAGQLFLGGNYGAYGWVGFENPEAVEANVKVPLLGSVTVNPWTYEDVVINVGTFICGVGRANGATQDLSGATFTVELRLTNPADETEYYVVERIDYVFENPTDLPAATVQSADVYENVTLDWENYNGITPKDSNQQLEAAYTFAAQDTAATVAESPYKDWICDYYVSIDTDLEAGQLFLGGNYGSYGWVGFENPEAVEANVEVPLLGSVTVNPWTYEDVVTSVGTFICGVARANDATQDLTGATFTVELRLTNPNDANEYYSVSTINYTFN